jgi:hypothetical protein
MEPIYTREKVEFLLRENFTFSNVPEIRGMTSAWWKGEQVKLIRLVLFDLDKCAKENDREYVLNVWSWASKDLVSSRTNWQWKSEMRAIWFNIFRNAKEKATAFAKSKGFVPAGAAAEEALKDIKKKQVENLGGDLF